jgi:hypothetical protein
MPPIDLHSGGFFLLLLLGAAVTFGIAPEFAPALVLLAFLWGLVSYPVVAITLAILWCVRWLVWDFLVALIAGFGGGLGSGLPGSSVEDADHRVIVGGTGMTDMNFLDCDRCHACRLVTSMAGQRDRSEHLWVYSDHRHHARCTAPGAGYLIIWE